MKDQWGLRTSEEMEIARVIAGSRHMQHFPVDEGQNSISYFPRFDLRSQDPCRHLLTFRHRKPSIN